MVESCWSKMVVSSLVCNRNRDLRSSGVLSRRMFFEVRIREHVRKITITILTEKEALFRFIVKQTAITEQRSMNIVCTT